MLLQYIRPLDCIFFRGNSQFAKTIVGLQKTHIGEDDWTHVGIVINKRTMPSLKVCDKDELYLWESKETGNRNCCNSCVNADPLVDAETGKAVFGVQIRNLKKVVEYALSTGATVGWGKLRYNPIDRKLGEHEVRYRQRYQNIRKSLDKIHEQYHHRGYQNNPFRLLAAVIPGWSCCRTSMCYGENLVFCSEFVTIIYKELKEIPETVDEETVMPQDLATPHLSSEGLPKLFRTIMPVRMESL